MAMKKGRRMTAREKRLAAEVRAELREKGLLPEKKKPLNRRRFIEEARDILRKDGTEYGFTLYLYWALGEMLGHAGGCGQGPDLEAVGAAKAIQLAKRRMDFEAAQKAQGREQWTVGEICEAVMGVYKA